MAATSPSRAALLSDRGTEAALLSAITVVTCPNAAAWPSQTRSRTGQARGQAWVLFKHAGPLDSAARIGAVVLDKTGRLTLDTPEVTDALVALRRG